VSAVDSDQAADRIDAEAYSVEELRAAVSEGRGPLSRPLALGLLARKQYDQKVDDLGRVLTDAKEMPRLRAMAAQALGEMHEPAAVRALERGLETQDGVTLRAVAKALGQAGNPDHVARLEDLAQRSDLVGREAERAAGVLRQRLGQPKPGRPSWQPARGPGRPDDWTAIEAEPPGAEDVRQVAEGARGVRLAREGGLSLRCQGRHLLFLFTEDALGRGLDAVASPGDIGVVAQPHQVEGVGFEQTHRVAVEPRGGGEFDVVVTTHDGRPVFAGQGRVQGGEARFDLGTVDRPGALSVEISGRFDGRELRLESGRSATRRRSSPAPALRLPPT
jgi:hypothetical protein